jgi:ABC-type branched-subunit amino acid transport system substrate-binding protein
VIGHYSPAAAMGAVKAYDAAELPCLSPNVSAPSVIGASKYLFSTNVDDRDQGGFMAAYLKEVLKKDQVLVVHTKDTFGVSLRDAFTKKAAAIGLTVRSVLAVDDEVAPDIVAKALPDKDARAKIGSVVALTHSEQGLGLLPQLREAGIKATVLAPNTWTNPKLLEIDEKVAGEVFVTSSLLWEIANEKATRFADDYKKRHGAQPPVTAALAFDAALLVTKGFEALSAPDKDAKASKGRPTRKGLRDWLAGLRWQEALDGATGPLFFDSSDDRTRSYVEKFLEEQRKDKEVEAAKKVAEAAAREAEAKADKPADKDAKHGDKPAEKAGDRPAEKVGDRPAEKDAKAHGDKPAEKDAKAHGETAPAAAKDPKDAKATEPAKVVATPSASPSATPSAAPAATADAKAEPAEGAPSHDEDGTVQRDVFVSMIHNGRYKVAYTQLLEPKEEYILQELKERVKKGYVAVVDGQPYHVVDVVYVGIDIVKINDVNTRDMNWDADMFMWFKWMGDRLDGKDIDKIGVVNAVKEQSSLLKEDLSRPVKYRAFRRRYTLGTGYDLAKFPFDKQSVTMTVAHGNKNSTHLMLVLDTKHMDDGPIDKINPQEWNYVGRRFFSNLYQYASTFGDPDYRRGKGYKSRIYFSTVNAEVELQRIIQPYLFTFFLPLVIILGIILLVLWVPLDQFAPRINACISGLVGILVYHMSQKNSFPKVGYAMVADYYFRLLA